jgi:hypothetical protein
MTKPQFHSRVSSARVDDCLGSADVAPKVKLHPEEYRRVRDEARRWADPNRGADGTDPSPGAFD